MQYKKIRIDINPERINELIDTVINCGILSYEVIDGIYDIDIPEYDELKPEEKNLKASSVVFYVDENEEDYQSIISKIQKSLINVEVKISTVNDSDWKDKWKDYFHSFAIGNILIKPSWEDVDSKEYESIIEIDPGMAFGTGAHETTKMCIEKMSEIDIDSFLDVGCGSGILSIAASKLGCKDIHAIDIDPDCMDVAKENMENNGVKDFTLYCENILENRPDFTNSFSVICANILADIIIEAMPYFKKHLKNNGYLITSGIIEGKENRVIDAFKQFGFSYIEVKKDGEWYMVAGRKNE